MKPRIAIIGAGLSGVSLAHLLGEKAHITLFEKSRRPGGRLATRDAPPYHFDHGAQYFTARSDAFCRFIQPLIEQGMVAPWLVRYTRFMADQAPSCDDQVRYVGVPDMNTLVRYYAQNMPVMCNTRIINIQRKGACWQIEDDKGEVSGGFDWVVLALPAPQAKALLPTQFCDAHLLQSIDMQPCFALMLGFAAPLDFAFDAAHVHDGDIRWLAVNSTKPQRNSTFTLVVHSSPEYAEAALTQPQSEIIAHLRAQTSTLIKADAELAAYQKLHRWMYANNTPLTDIKDHQGARKPCLYDAVQKLAVIGDWCLGGRVENAFLSAYHLHTTLVQQGVV